MISEISINNEHGDVEINVKNGNRSYHLISMGRKSYISQAWLDYGSIRTSILIGRYTSIAHRVVFEIGLNHNHNLVSSYPFRDYEAMGKPDNTDIGHYYENNHYQIIIGNDVWIGEGVKILGGVHIGNGAVIGMGAVVTRDVPPYAVVVGNPARFVKYRFDEDVIAKLEEIKWWNWEEDAIDSAMSEMNDPYAFAQKYYKGLNIPRNEFTNAMDQMVNAGGKIYYYVLDYDAPRPFWYKVLYMFKRAFEHDNTQMLIIEFPKEHANNDVFFPANTIIDRFCSECKGIIKIVKKDSASTAVFFHASTYIAGADIRSLAYIDMAEYLGMTVKSACDWESGLFEKDIMNDQNMIEKEIKNLSDEIIVETICYRGEKAKEDALKKDNIKKANAINKYCENMRNTLESDKNHFDFSTRTLF